MRTVHLSTLLGRGITGSSARDGFVSMLPLRTAFLYLRAKELLRTETFETAKIWLQYRSLAVRAYYPDGRILYEGRTNHEPVEKNVTRQFRLFPGDIARFFVRLLYEDTAFRRAVPFRSCEELLLHSARFQVPVSYLFLADRPDYYLPALEEDDRNLIYYLSALPRELRRDLCRLKILVPVNTGGVHHNGIPEYKVIETDVTASSGDGRFLLQGNRLFYQDRAGEWKSGRLRRNRFQDIPVEKEQHGLIDFDGRGHMLYLDKKNRVCRKTNQKDLILCPESSSGYQLQLREDQMVFIPHYLDYAGHDPGLPFAVTFSGERKTLTSQEYAAVFWQICNGKCLTVITPDLAEGYLKTRRKMNHSALTLAGMTEIAKELEEACLWKPSCAAGFSRMLQILSEKYYKEQELRRLMFRMLYLCGCANRENLWSDRFLRNFDSFIRETGEPDWPDYLMTERAETVFSA